MSADSKTWIWKKNARREEEELWEERLAERSGAVIREEVGKARLEVTVYSGSKAEAVELRQRFGGSVEVVGDRDWVAESARPEPPLVVRNVLVVTQEVDREALGELEARYPGRRVLSVPAQMAFGTGHHATTSTCLRMLADIGKRRGQVGGSAGWSMVDIGTGSGLLALGARILGAETGAVDGFDFDGKAVEIAWENAGRNGITGVRFWIGDVLEWKPERRYDVVAANLYSSLLTEALPKMRGAAEPGGDLILSGILRTQADEVLEAAEDAGFSISKVVCRGKWVGVQGQVRN